MKDNYTIYGIQSIEEMIKNSKNNSEEKGKDSRIKKIPTWVRIAVEVIDESLIPSYKELLTDYVTNGPGDGKIMDTSMLVLKALKSSTGTDYAANIMYNNINNEEKKEKNFIQNMVLAYSDKGPEFVSKTLGRELTAEEIVTLDIKRREILQKS